MPPYHIEKITNRFALIKYPNLINMRYTTEEGCEANRQDENLLTVLHSGRK